MSATERARQEAEALMRQARDGAAEAVRARAAGAEEEAERRFRRSLRAAEEASESLLMDLCLPFQLAILQAAAEWALNCGEPETAARMVGRARQLHDPVVHLEGWVRLSHVGAWEEAWLIAAVRRSEPFEPALDELVDRHWKPLFARCQMLTLHRDFAHDLAQDTWRRVLRARRSLKPGGNFSAYLRTTASNLWRDRFRAARRAGPLGESQLASLDAPIAAGEGETGSLAAILPDLETLASEQRRILMLDVDEALAKLPPDWRAVLVARMIEGESCAEIGRRYGRTEQTISGWIRLALKQLREDLSDVLNSPRDTAFP